jgi:outer membrane lipoprotein carrier protein
MNDFGLIRPVRVAVAAVVALLGLFHAAWAGTLEDLMERQKGVETVKAAFVQEKHALLLDKPIKSEGFFYYKRSAGVRWQYRSGMLVVYDGKWLYVFDPESNQAERVKGAKEAIGPLNLDLKLLAGDYDMKALKTRDGIRLTLVPQNKMPFKSIVLDFADRSPFPRAVATEEESGDSTTIEFHDMVLNGAVPDDLFTFTPPQGVQIKDRELK